MPTPKIVVIGSSYSAAAAFNYLERSLAALREPFDLLLLSNKNHYLNKDLLSQYLCDSCNLEDTCQWLRGIVFLRAGVSYLESDILNIGFQSKTIFTSKGEISYQYLVLAPHNDLYDEPAFDKESNAFIIKNPDDVLRLRIHILSNIEKAVSENNPEAKNLLLTFSVIGTDREGIQLACSISDFTNRLLRNHFPEIKKSFLKINLIEENNLISINKDPFFNNRIFYNLNKRGIALLTNSHVNKIENNIITINNKDKISSGTIILSNPKSSSALIQKLYKTKSLDSCNVDLYLKLEGLEDVFMIGELAKCMDIREDFPKTDLFYNDQAKTCATNICTKINNSPMKLLKSDLEINFLSLGYRNSLLECRNIHIDNVIAWFLHRMLYIFCSLSWKKKLRAFVGLICNIFGLSEFEQMNVYELRQKKQAIKK
ncbi:MAG: hypothetical protein A3I68_08360 [Candidatus Melainabacteria bacterium RIFCSPLOWO2_02_FULL_35_15]|nr:MAG: hypothetical protein A3I68_08360 [Candidatus Melainabacteria bacterium RIFCSPLOWO2_02_FULL_35_15]